MGNRFETFKSWHHQESLWREIYARTISGLTVALVIFLVAVSAGVIRTGPKTFLVIAAYMAPFLFLAPAFRFVETVATRFRARKRHR